MFSELELKHLPWKPKGSNGETSRIYVAPYKGRQLVKKVIREGYEEELQNEINCLQALQDSPHFPTLYAYNIKDRVLYMAYCGKAMTLDTRPLNWEEQINAIVQDIYQANITYSDIKPEHLCVYNDNTIRVIDVGRATVGPQTRSQDIYKFATLAKDVV